MAGLTLAVAGLGLSAYQMSEASKDKKDAKRELANLEVPEIENAFEDLQISTVGSDLMREESQRTTASAIDAIRGGGARTVMGAIPKLVGVNNSINQESRAYLDGQVQRRDYAIAGDKTRMQGMNENRYMGDVMGLNNVIQQSEQNMWSGARGAFGALGYLGRSIGGANNVDGVANPPVTGFERRVENGQTYEVDVNGVWQPVNN